ncbi:MAG: 16S rRNA (guanine(527)-N(7))-methyltransferase RsmG [Halieaceae bacterium]|nr:16S rRNA (guanine(527)-N(7))-methyltransferase RsmG [Halieaceae bacterium]
MLALQLRAGLAEMALDVDERAQTRLLDYLELLQRWNSAYNLTAIRDASTMVTRHLLDSLALLPHAGSGRLIDVGSGAGLPGVPLAIVQPWRSVTVLDSNGKKTRFLEHTRLTLGLDNLEVIRARCEEYRPALLYDQLTSRAFAALDDMIRGCCHLLAPDGEYLAMKGQYPEAELEAAKTLARLIAVEPLAVPGLDEARCVVRLRA